MNQCQFEYNNFGQLVKEYQSHDGAVNVSTTPQVGYTYADGSNNTIRQTGLVCPNGRIITYDYGAAESIDDFSSRIAAILDDDDSTLAGFAILGRDTFVEQDNPEPQIKWTLIDFDDADDPDTGDIYSGLDRFGRVKDCRWYSDNSEEDIVRLKYGYDQASNRTWRQDTVANALNKDFYEIYLYDGLHRLKDMQCGRLNGTHNLKSKRSRMTTSDSRSDSIKLHSISPLIDFFFQLFDPDLISSIGDRCVVFSDESQNPEIRMEVLVLENTQDYIHMSVSFSMPMSRDPSSSVEIAHIIPKRKTGHESHRHVK